MSILVLGDLFYGYDYISEDIFEISKYIKKNNLKVVLNLEGAITENKSFLIKKRGEHLAQNINVIEVLKLLNVEGVSLCNNHMFDFGLQGLLDTVRILDENGIKHFGAGRNKIEASAPMIIKDNNLSYEFYSATDPFEESICCENDFGCYNILDLKNTKLNCSQDTYKIAFLHTGFEYNTFPTKRTIYECRGLVENGFDSVICSHPHITQPHEIYMGKSIYYSIGNFYFSTDREEFHEKKIRNKKSGFCNIGIGRVLNGDNTKCIKINYNKDLNISFIDGEVTPDLLEYDQNDSDYKKKFMINRNNHNPFLTGEYFKDNVKMFVLNFIYKVYGIVRKLGIIRR